MHGEVGQVLREAREARGVELEEVQRATKIRARFLAAIEDERWDLLPGRAYAVGFVRTYAEFLGLDPAPLVGELRRDIEPGEHDEEVPPEPIVQRGQLPTGLRRRISPRLVAAVLGAGAAVVVLALAITAGQGDPDPMPAPPPGAEEPVSEDEVEPEAEQPPADEEEPPATEDPEPERVSLVLEATGTVWVCLVDGRGDPLVEGETLDAGESRGPFEARRMLMTFGNGQVDLTADGSPFEVPEAADPLGYEVTPEGVEELAPPERPTCG